LAVTLSWQHVTIKPVNWVRLTYM